MSYILYMEDDGLLALVRLDQWEEDDHSSDEIRHAANLPSALAIIEEHGPPSLIISDFEFPGKTPRSGGIDLLAHVTRHYPDIPFFFQSSHDVLPILSAVQAQGLHLRADHVYQKSVPLSQIVLYANYLAALQQGRDVPVPDRRPRGLRLA
ncbi:MAG: hypothetical protein KGI37_00090 [Alphaproteobacteria bacterium]|nr:hypothetical protein [Alphaproteobacteria bacterium]